MKKLYFLIAVAIFVSALFCGCSGRVYPSDVPKEAVDLYYDYLDALSDGFTDALAEKYLHIEIPDPEPFTGQCKVAKYKIFGWEALSDKLWVVSHNLTVTDYPEIGEGVNFVGIVDGEYRVMRGVIDIPEELKEGLDLERFEYKL